MWTPNKNNLSRFQIRRKSHHLNPPLSNDERQRFEREDEECLATIYYGPIHSKTSESVQVITDRSVNEKLARLSEVYTINSQVEEFILENDFLFQPLFQALDQIKDLFGNTTKLRLTLLHEGSARQLFAVILTPLEPEKALTRLRSFDKDWWFNVPHEIHDFLEFTIEFV